MNDFDKTKAQLIAELEALRRKLAALEVGASSSIAASEVSQVAIAARQQAELALRDSEARYHALVEAQAELVWRFTPEGYITFVNDACCRFWGETRAQITGSSIYFRMSLDAREPVREVLSSLTPDMPALDVTFQVVRENGTFRWYQWTNHAFFDHDGHIVEIQAVGRDVSLRKQIEDALRKTVDELQSIFRAAPTGIGLVSKRVILQANDRLCEMLGYTAGELIGQNARMLYLTDEDYNFVGDEKYTQIQVYGTGTVETRWRHKDGHIIDVLLSSTPLDPAELALGVTFTALDITDRKRIEAELENHRQHLEYLVKERTVELEEANARLHVLSRVKDEFVSNVSHELRTPITVMVMRQHLLRKQPERLDEHLGVIERETRRLKHTIDDLLRLSRLEQDRTDVVLASLDLNLLVWQYVADRRLLAEQKGLTFVFEAQPDLPLVSADPGLLGQVLSILLTNTLNYTPAQGTATISTQAETFEGRSWAGFSVRDTGPGIPPGEQAQLFERFFRGTAGRNSEAPGTGLGLAIAKEIVERHQGRISVQSDGIAGAGATFSVWLLAVE